MTGLTANDYAVTYLVRFNGTQTSGTNAGTTYTYHNSWTGQFFHTRGRAEEHFQGIREREPGMGIILVRREYRESIMDFVETVIRVYNPSSR